MLELFPTKVYLNNVVAFKEIQEELKVVADDMEWQNLWDTHLISDDSFRDNLIKQYNLTAFEAEVRSQVRDYITQWQKTDLEFDVVTSWMTKFNKGMYGVCHEHGWSDISGVYYYQTNGEDGDIYFQTPVLAQTTCFWDSTPNTVSFPPCPGGIILFPGWLRHGVHSNTTDHTRMSVSFNITFTRP